VVDLKTRYYTYGLLTVTTPVFQITVVDGAGCQEEGGLWYLLEEKTQTIYQYSYLSHISSHPGDISGERSRT
jgi:hypothetical protein